MDNHKLLKEIEKLDPTYQLGLHSVNVLSHKISTSCKKNKERYVINKENITEKDIVENILNNGLYIGEKSMGLTSTVSIKGYVNQLSPKIFDYIYHHEETSENKAFVIIVILPTFIHIKEKEYFIGENSQYFNSVNIANDILFNYLLPKEFIYGYYSKDFAEVNDNLIFGEELNFYKNPNFYDFISDKEKYWIEFFKNNKINLSILQAVNNPTFLNSIIYKQHIKWVIENTKNQKLSLRKK